MAWKTYNFVGKHSVGSYEKIQLMQGTTETLLKVYHKILFNGENRKARHVGLMLRALSMAIDNEKANLPKAYPNY